MCGVKGGGGEDGPGGGFVRPVVDGVRLLSTLGNCEVAFLAASCARG